MPINHFPTDIPQPLWWIHQQPLMEPIPTKFSDFQRPNPTATASPFYGQNTGFNFNLNQEDDELDPVDEREEDPTRGQLLIQDQFYQQVNKEPMFEKPLTPSDVGKLNRLVIPKQHAEKYFPLSGDSGLLLSFEDESGKCWRFRYSYWNSSQSYVLTKGWSRFVKEKRLDAGDVVLFERHRFEGDRLFIGWRRRGMDAAAAVQLPAASPAVRGTSSGGGVPGWGRLYYPAQAYPVHPPPHGNGASIQYQPDCLHAGAGEQTQTTPSGNSKTLRLFGVNLECHQQPDESEPSTPDGSSTSSQGQPHYYHYSITQTHMAQDINFSRGANQMRYHQG